MSNGLPTDIIESMRHPGEAVPDLAAQKDPAKLKPRGVAGLGVGAEPARSRGGRIRPNSSLAGWPDWELARSRHAPEEAGPRPNSSLAGWPDWELARSRHAPGEAGSGQTQASRGGRIGSWRGGGTLPTTSPPPKPEVV
eukprot:gene16206-biopygen13131